MLHMGKIRGGNGTAACKQWARGGRANEMLLGSLKREAVWCGWAGLKNCVGHYWGGVVACVGAKRC